MNIKRQVYKVIKEIVRVIAIGIIINLIVVVILSVTVDFAQHKPTTVSRSVSIPFETVVTIEYNTIGSTLLVVYWHYYNGEPISFSMNEQRFLADLQMILDSHSVSGVPTNNEVFRLLLKIDEAKNYDRITGYGYDSVVVSTFARGWPFRSFACDYIRNPTNMKWVSVNAYKNISAGEWSNSRPLHIPSQRCIPLGIRVNGFALNSVIYGVAISLCLTTLNLVIKSVRRARGLCPACGYKMYGHSPVCSECGHRNAM